MQVEQKQMEYSPFVDLASQQSYLRLFYSPSKTNFLRDFRTLANEVNFVPSYLQEYLDLCWWKCSQELLAEVFCVDVEIPAVSKVLWSFIVAIAVVVY